MFGCSVVAFLYMTVPFSGNNLTWCKCLYNLNKKQAMQKWCSLETPFLTYIMPTTYLLLGTNLGNKLNNLQQATERIMGRVGDVTAVSWLYQTDAWGKTNQAVFLNQVLCVDTQLSPTELLDQIQQIEIDLGRERHEKWGARTIDIDILFYDQQTIITQRLLIPHPYLHTRRFTLMPLNDLAPNFVHPTLHKTTQQLLDECQDPLNVTRVW